MQRFCLSMLIIVASLQVLAQNCFDFHKINCCPLQADSYTHYAVSSNSTSFALKPGDSRCIVYQIFSGKDYRLTICSDSLYSGIVSFQIRDDNNNVLYDNSEEDFNPFFEFSCRKTTHVEFVISAPNRSDVVPETKGCIGLLIEEAITPRLGF